MIQETGGLTGMFWSAWGGPLKPARTGPVTRMLMTAIGLRRANNCIYVRLYRRERSASVRQ